MVAHQPVDRADLGALHAVVAQQWIDDVDHRKAGRLGDRTGRTGGLAGTTAKALVLVDLEAHG
jgi:hypothetical protein